MATDTQLDLFAPTQECAAQILELLRGQGWMTSADILAVFGTPPTEAAKRRLRRVANTSGGQIASGQNGYKLTCELTDEEFQHFEAWFGSQIVEMQARRRDVREIFSRKGATAPRLNSIENTHE